MFFFSPGLRQRCEARESRAQPINNSMPESSIFVTIQQNYFTLIEKRA
jgi:hypothetical protein